MKEEKSKIKETGKGCKDINFFIEVGPILEYYHTGIAKVNLGISSYFINKKNTFFFFNDRLVKRNIIKYILNSKHGFNLESLPEEIFEGEITSIKNKKYSVGIFSNIKYLKNFFDYDVQIIHDISYLLTPEFHFDEAIRWYANSVERDLAENNLNVFMSESTKEDVETYLKPKLKNAIVSYQGYLKLDHKINEFIEKNEKVEKFIIIIGTIEPRKNIDLIFEFIKDNQKILNDYKFVFIGKNGWGEDFNTKLRRYNLNNKKLSDNLIHLGYVSEVEKLTLLKLAEFAIYPSFYEGFGRPVLEAFTVGCPVLCSCSSSLPEVGGDAARYFDPHNIESFKHSFESFINELKDNREDIVKKSIIQSEKFSWKKFGDEILDKILKEIRIIKTDKVV